MAVTHNRMLLALTFLAGAALVGCQDLVGPSSGGFMENGPKAPPIKALGWINSPAATAATLNTAGEVVVIDVFASW